MKVSELARRAGIAASAIRFYEAEGLLPTPKRGPSGYREYEDADLCQLRVLVSLRSLGLDLAEAGRLAGICGAGRCDEMVEDLLPRIVARRQEIAQTRIELDHLDARLADLEERLRSGETMLGISDEEGVLCGPDCPDCCAQG